MSKQLIDMTPFAGWIGRVIAISDQEYEGGSIQDIIIISTVRALEHSTLGQTPAVYFKFDNPLDLFIQLQILNPDDQITYKTPELEKWIGQTVLIGTRDQEKRMVTTITAIKIRCSDLQITLTVASLRETIFLSNQPDLPDHYWRVIKKLS